MAPQDPTRLGAPPPIPTVDTVRWADDPRPRLDPDDPQLLEQLRPSSTRPWWRTPIAGVFAAGAAIIGVATFAEVRADAWRLAAPGCDVHEVTRGDTLSGIARNYGITLDDLKAMNPQLAEPGWDRIWPGDHVAYACPTGAAAPERVDLPRPEWAAIKAQPYFSCTVAGQQWNFCVSDERIVVALFEAGWRGDELVTMAATTFGEGAPAIDAVGDRNIADGIYGPSFGVVQVRSQWAMDHTGGPRDRFALWNPADPQASLDHQAWAAREVYRSQGWKAWTNHRNGGHLPHLDRMRAVAEQIGAL